MIKTIIKLLKENENLYAWNVNAIKKDSYQLFFIRQQLDMNREVIVNEYKVTIFTKEVSGRKEKIGSSSFNIYPSMSPQEISDKIEEQIKISKYTLNEMFRLPKKNSVMPKIQEVGFDRHTLKDAAFIVADDLFETDNYVNGYINSTEIFINFIEERFYDSNGNEFVTCKEVGEVEFVTTWAEDGKEIELYNYIEFGSLDESYIKGEANKMFAQAGERYKATKTPVLSNYKLVLSDENAKGFFLHFVDKTSTDMIYGRQSDFYEGQNIQNNSKGDKLTIKLDPVLKHSTESYLFDSEGTVLKKICLIDKGIVTNFHGSNAKSQYIGKKPNGMPKNLLVNAGSLVDSMLDDENYVEIISASGLEIDTITGDFGSEIRLAYLHNKNKEVIPITGGSFSGNIYKCLDTILLSNETIQCNNYLGPKKILIDNISFNKGV